MPGGVEFADFVGWLATGVFVSSYFCKSSAALRSLQMAGAMLWAGYGIIIGASPVIVANTLVFAAAAWTTMRARLPPSHGAERR
jgi:hypothetical protein